MNKFHKFSKRKNRNGVTNEMPKEGGGNIHNRRASGEREVITEKRFETNGTEPLAAPPLTGLDSTIPTTPPILQPTLNAPGGGGGDRGTLGSRGEASGSGRDGVDSGWMPPTDS